MLKKECEYYDEQTHLIVGVDEAGRGLLQAQFMQQQFFSLPPFMMKQSTIPKN